jgi:hypothetical protein
MKVRGSSGSTFGRNAASLLLIAGVVLIIIGIVMQIFAVYPTDETGRIIWKGTDPSAVLARLIFSTILLLAGIAIVGFFLFHNPRLAEESAAALMEYDRERTEMVSAPQERRLPSQPMSGCKTCGTMNEVGATYCIGCATPLMTRDQIQGEKSDKEEEDLHKENVQRMMTYLTGWLLFVEVIAVILVTIVNILNRTTIFEFIGQYIAGFVFIYLIAWAFLARPNIQKIGLALLVWTITTTVFLSYSGFLNFYWTNW